MMKKILILAGFIILTLAGCSVKKAALRSSPSGGMAENASSSFDFSKQETWILGYFNPVRLTEYPYGQWYLSGYDNYKPDPGVMEKLDSISKDDLSIKIAMGTWCPDSRREVPGFMKIMEIWKFPADRITFIGVDNAKLSPVAEYENLGIVRVPTFIIYRNKVEAGRIIENPVTSLEQDILNILIKSD